MMNFKWRKIKDDDIYGKNGYTLNLLRPNIYQFASQGVGSHVYLVIGDDRNVLIDPGIISKFDSFNYLLTTEIGLKVEDIDLIIGTHEHFDHISTNMFFSCPIAAHRWAATKIQHSDELITKAKANSVDMDDFRIDIWLENRNVFDLGNVLLEVMETPGHTSGSICIYEPHEHYMFTGDTLFCGNIPNIYESGSISELIDSLQYLSTLRINSFFPGHGRSVFTEEEVKKEIIRAMDKAEQDLQSYIEEIHSKPLGDTKVPPSLYKTKK
ncbi:MAG: MBL fold metallo-hydrolase [archaeon]|nr:MBL fold metallo-hydrolase [archaeon]